MLKICQDDKKHSLSLMQVHNVIVQLYLFETDKILPRDKVSVSFEITF